MEDVDHGELQSDTATVTITVIQPNRLPIANDIAYFIDFDTELVVPTPGVLINDTDPDGSFTYTSDDDFSGVDTFTYRASDGKLRSDPATVTLTVAEDDDDDDDD